MYNYTEYQLEELENAVKEFNDENKKDYEHSTAQGYIYGLQCGKEEIYRYSLKTHKMEKKEVKHCLKDK